MQDAGCKIEIHRESLVMDRASCLIHVSREQDTVQLGEIIGRLLEPKDIVALCGELGAGKTVLVKGIAKGLGVEEEPNSPTFVIMNAYDGRIPLYHFDLYRLRDARELEGIGYEDYFFGNGVSVVEWADRVDEVFPERTIKVDIKIPDQTNSNPHTREIKVGGEEKWVSLFRSTAERALQISKK